MNESASFEVPYREPCPFCENIASGGTISRAGGGFTACAVVDETPQTFAFISPRQASEPHILVSPRRHATTLLDLTEEEATAVARHVHRLARAVKNAFSPVGLNVYQASGTAAGQTVGHCHTRISFLVTPISRSCSRRRRSP